MIKQTFSWEEVPDGDAFRKLAQAVLSNQHPGEMLSPDAPGKDFGIDDKWSPVGKKATVYSFKRIATKKSLLGAVKRDAERLKKAVRHPFR